MKNILQKSHGYSEPQNVALFGSRVSADIVKDSSVEIVLDRGWDHSPVTGVYKRKDREIHIHVVERR